MKKRIIALALCAALCGTLRGWAFASPANAAEVSENITVPGESDATEKEVSETTVAESEMDLNEMNKEITESEVQQTDMDTSEQTVLETKDEMIVPQQEEVEDEMSTSDEAVTNSEQEIAPGVLKAEIREESKVLYAGGISRLWGKNRYETSMAIANAQLNRYSSLYDGGKFDNVIIANGDNFADALAGSYLSFWKNAPILIVDKTHEQQIINYVASHATNNGTIYILGGKAVVSDNVYNGLNNKGFSVKRLWGQDRYETNLAILKEADKVAEYEDVLVCTGTNFADSLSASATGMPILLVNKELSSAQKAYLKTRAGKSDYYLIGGPAVVSNTVANQLKSYSSYQKRIYGKNRYETSAKIATYFFKDYWDSKPGFAVLAYGDNFPDGLCGGPLAQFGAPLLLVRSSDYAYAAQFCKSYQIKSITVLGGATLISDGVAKAMLQ